MAENVNAVATKRTDPSVQLPEAVRRAAARANELSEQQRAQSNNPEGNSQGNSPPFPPHTPTPSTPTTPTLTLSNASAPSASDGSLEQAPASRGASAPTQTTLQTKSYTEDEFRAMQGRYVKAQDENKLIARRLEETQRLLAGLNAPDLRAGAGHGDVTFNVPINPGFRAPAKPLITAEERKEWTDEMLDVVGRRALEVVAPEVNALRAENERLRQQVGGVQNVLAGDARERIYDELDKEVPEWSTINNDEQFKNWLRQVEPLAGAPRGSLLNEAFQRGEASRVVAAFKGYRAELAASGPAQTRGSQSGNGAESSEGRNATNSQSNPATTPAVDLLSLAAPGRARSGQMQTGSPDKPIVTGAEIKAFYQDVTHGKYAGRDKEYNAIEAQIQEALREGRVVR